VCWRQVRRWKRQYEAGRASLSAASVEESPEVASLVTWLEEHAAESEEAAKMGPTLVHGDFKLDNLVSTTQWLEPGAVARTRHSRRGAEATPVIEPSRGQLFHPTDLRVVAVVDWELATIGHPLADLAHCCQVRHAPPTSSTLARSGST
jgi:aminoglycoside phosphotransferase (APT) family kinase protein